MIPVGREPIQPVFADGAVWVPNTADGSVSRIDVETSEVTHVIDVEGNGTSEGTDNVGGYDLIWDNGPVRTEQRTCYSTFLGGHNAHEDTPLETKRTRAAEGAAAQAAAQAAQQAAAAQAAQ